MPVGASFAGEYFSLMHLESTGPESAATARLKRGEIRELSRLARNGDTTAAKTLVQHSLLCGHKKLGIRRYLLALALDADGLDRFETQVRILLAELEPADLSRMVRDTRSIIGKLK